MKFDQFQSLSLQLSIFTPQTSFSTSKVFAQLIASFGNIFDGAPISFPLPSEAPRDIPNIILANSNGSLKFEISEKRINLFSFRQYGDSGNFSAFIEMFKNVIDTYLVSTSATVGRLAVVQVRGLKCDEPGKKLAEHFCKKELLQEPFNRPENFEIHAHKKYPLGKFNINSWVRCKTGMIKDNSKPVVIVEQDINTLNEEILERNFSKDEILSFVNEMLPEQDLILKKYFS